VGRRKENSALGLKRNHHTWDDNPLVRHSEKKISMTGRGFEKIIIKILQGGGRGITENVREKIHPKSSQSRRGRKVPMGLAGQA